MFWTRCLSEELNRFKCIDEYSYLFSAFVCCSVLVFGMMGEEKAYLAEHNQDRSVDLEYHPSKNAIVSLNSSKKVIS